MYDAGKVIAGLVIFVVLLTSPIWYNLAKGEGAVKVNPVVDESAIQDDRERMESVMKQLGMPYEWKRECVADSAYMRASHMDLLNEWRDLVVRSGERVHTAPSGRKFEMSLSNECMFCHRNKSKFCDECHNPLGVNPYCWDCHIEPKEGT